MKLSHLVYKVPNLADAVSNYQNEGFHVEYGSKVNPHNALIYFSEGPYIELLERVPISATAKLALKIMGKGKAVQRLESWEQGEEGLVDLCLENYADDFKEEEVILKKFSQKYSTVPSKRHDPKDRILKWKMLFPEERDIPFFMTYFKQDPKPQNFVHPNGTTKIKSVSFGTREEFIPLIKALCDDEDLELFVGKGEIDFQYER